VTLEKKKVLLINWILLDVGGITTWGHQIVRGFQKIGWQADHYYATRTGRFKCSETEFTPIGDKFKRGEKIPSKSLGFKGAWNKEYYVQLLENYDYVIFIHPSPHPTKGNLAAEGMSEWKDLYTLCKKPKVVIFHDKKWHKTNEWFAEVHDEIDVILAAQHNFIESVQSYADLPGKKILTDWLYFPIDTDGCECIHPSKKEYRLGMFAQWIKWKNHIAILETGNDIKIPIHFYNGGMEYHKLVWTSDWNSAMRVDWVEDCYVTKENKHEYHGFQSYEKIKEIYKKTLGSIDLTTRSYQNYTHHEPSLYGSVLLCTEECRQGPYNHIYDGEYWPIDLADVTKSVNDFADLSEDSKYNIVLPAFNRTMENFACEKIATKINSIVENLP
jgi:hypothetical protein